jgi:hypothetical protein
VDGSEAPVSGAAGAPLRNRRQRSAIRAIAARQNEGGRDEP